ncbi:MAG: hypothetical protein Q8Q18_00550 [bacterium]|nr:hypothetical protein [bacterium]
MYSDRTRGLVLAVLLILVGIASYGLGQRNKLENADFAVEITKNSFFMRAGTASALTPAPTNIAGVISADDAKTGQIVASKSGSKYHFAWCGSAKSIKEANRIYFDSTDAARSAGYTPASNCAGLK